MTEMIERVARALAPMAWASINAGDTAAQKHRRAASLRHARAAIEAMREPTDEMLHAPDVKEWPEDAKYAWYAMIDAALLEARKKAQGE